MIVDANAVTLSATWGTFAGLVGATSGALLGLLFVAVSINRERMARHPGLQAAAGQTLIVFVLPLLLSLAMATPDQATRVVGVEVVATGLLVASALLALGRWKRRASTPSHSRLTRLLNSTSPTVSITLLLLVAGVLLLLDHPRGLYWAVPAIALAWIGGTLNAWLFLFQHED